MVGRWRQKVGRSTMIDGGAPTFCFPLQRYDHGGHHVFLVFGGRLNLSCQEDSVVDHQKEKEEMARKVTPEAVRWDPGTRSRPSHLPSPFSTSLCRLVGLKAHEKGERGGGGGCRLEVDRCVLELSRFRDNSRERVPPDTPVHLQQVLSHRMPGVTQR